MEEWERRGCTDPENSTAKAWTGSRVGPGQQASRGVGAGTGATREDRRAGLPLTPATATHTHVHTTQCSLSCTLTYVHTHRHAVLTHMYTLSCAYTGMCTHVLYAHSCTCTHKLTMGIYTLSRTCVPALALPPTVGGAQHPEEPGVQPSLVSTAHSSGLRKQMLSLHNKEVLPRVAFRWQCWVALGRDYSSEGKTCLPL